MPHASVISASPSTSNPHSSEQASYVQIHRMGNSLPLARMCQEANVVVTTAAGAKRNRRKRPAAKNVAVVVPVGGTTTEQDGDDEEEITKAWPAGCRVEPAGEGAVRVKVVMTRKEAAALMAKLQERAAAERKDRMGDLITGLGGGNGGVMSPCRDAWRPRLASIAEN